MQGADLLPIPRTLEYLETMVMPPSDMQSSMCRVQISFPNPPNLSLSFLDRYMSVRRCPVLSPCHPRELYTHQSC